VLEGQRGEGPRSPRREGPRSPREGGRISPSRGGRTAVSVSLLGKGGVPNQGHATPAGRSSNGILMPHLHSQQTHSQSGCSHQLHPQPGSSQPGLHSHSDPPAAPSTEPLSRPLVGRVSDAPSRIGSVSEGNGIGTGRVSPDPPVHPMPAGGVASLLRLLPSLSHFIPQSPSPSAASAAALHLARAAADANPAGILHLQLRPAHAQAQGLIEIEQLLEPAQKKEEGGCSVSPPRIYLWSWWHIRLMDGGACEAEACSPRWVDAQGSTQWVGSAGEEIAAREGWRDEVGLSSAGQVDHPSVSSSASEGGGGQPLLGGGMGDGHGAHEGDGSSLPTGNHSSWWRIPRGGAPALELRLMLAPERPAPHRARPSPPAITPSPSSTPPPSGLVLASDAYCVGMGRVPLASLPRGAPPEVLRIPLAPPADVQDEAVAGGERGGGAVACAVQEPPLSSGSAPSLMPGPPAPPRVVLCLHPASPHTVALALRTHTPHPTGASPPPAPSHARYTARVPRPPTPPPSLVAVATVHLLLFDPPKQQSPERRCAITGDAISAGALSCSPLPHQDKEDESAMGAPAPSAGDAVGDAAATAASPHGVDGEGARWHAAATPGAMNAPRPPWTMPEGGNVVVAGRLATVPERGAVIPEGGAAIPEGGGAIPEGGGAIPEGGGAIPEGCSASVGESAVRQAAGDWGKGHLAGEIASADLDGEIASSHLAGEIGRLVPFDSSSRGMDVQMVRAAAAAVALAEAAAAADEAMDKEAGRAAAQAATQAGAGSRSARVGARATARAVARAGAGMGGEGRGEAGTALSMCGAGMGAAFGEAREGGETGTRQAPDTGGRGTAAAEGRVALGSGVTSAACACSCAPTETPPPPLDDAPPTPLDELGFPVPSCHAEALRLSRSAAAADARLWSERWCAAVRAGAWGAPLPPWVQALGRSRFARVCPEARPHLWFVASGAAEMRRSAIRGYAVLCAEAEQLSHRPSHPVESSQLQPTGGAGDVPWGAERHAADMTPSPPPPPVYSHRLRATDAKQIDADLPRTFPAHSLFRCPGPAPSALRRILRAFALLNPSVGYCQSLNFVAAILFLVAGEEPAFWILAALCARVLPDYHTQTMAGLRIDTAAYGPVVAAAMPELHAHFERIEVRGEGQNETCSTSRRRRPAPVDFFLRDTAHSPPPAMPLRSPPPTALHSTPLTAPHPLSQRGA
jgi:hypothetical protein